jgi:hypothetical protein
MAATCFVKVAAIPFIGTPLRGKYPRFRDIDRSTTGWQRRFVET